MASSSRASATRATACTARSSRFRSRDCPRRGLSPQTTACSALGVRHLRRQTLVAHATTGARRPREYRVAAVTLHELGDHLEVIYGAALAFVIVILLTPAVAGMARRLGAVDQPDERRVHRIPIPRLGGLAIFFGIIVPSLAFLDLSRS